MEIRRVTVLLLLAGAMACFAQSPAKVENKRFPVPPEQEREWVPQKGEVSPEIVAASQKLFELGFSDPRGCEYREIVVKIGKENSSLPHSAVDFRTHGWVLPSESGTSPRYAIGWNGLVYPLVSVGAPANLDADIEKLLSQKVTEEIDSRRSWMESEELSVEKRSVCKIPLLLRLGKTDAAKAMWEQWHSHVIKNPWIEESGTGFDPFILMARDWLWANYNRVLQAHLRGDARMAVAFGNVIPSLRKKVEQFSRSHGISVKVAKNDQKLSPPTLDLSFLDQAPALLADDARRVREDVTNREEEINRDLIKEKAKRIALLIRDLEDVEAGAFTSPGYVLFSVSPIVQGLIAQGEDAVDPLLDCLENDHRLTRSLDQGMRIQYQNFYNSRVIGVEEPAFEALQGILKVQDQFPSLDVPYVNRSPGGEALKRIALAEKIREYWNKYRKETQPQRWYGILRDDKASPKAWAEAAGNIVLPDDQNLFSGYGLVFRYPNNSPSPKPGIWGEELRSKINPTVSELIIQRLKEAMEKKNQQNPSWLDSAQQLAMALAKWDGKKHLETLRWYCGELQKIILSQSESNGPGTIDNLVSIYLERLEAGDPTAAGEYSAWIRSTDATTLHYIAKDYGAVFFSPLWNYPDNPILSETAQWLFHDADSPWSIGSADPDPTWTVHSADLPLTGLPVFRSLLLQQLLDKRVIGHAEMKTAKQIMITYDKGHGSGWNVVDAPRAGTKRDLRLCDAIAYSISKIHGAPECEPYWTTEQKDEAIPKTILFLQRYGNRLLRKVNPQNLRPMFPEQSLALPALDHPATDADLAAGLAIFSMEGKGERKVYPLKKIPIRAKWTTLKDYPMEAMGYDPATKRHMPVRIFDQDGTIWQAEDILIGGKWKRYFGFVGKNCMAMVPAEEIQFDDLTFNAIDNGFGASININGYKETYMSGRIEKLDGPLDIQVWIKNLSGVERRLPKGKLIPGEMNAKDMGLKINLEYSPNTFLSITLMDSKWKTVTAKESFPITVMATPKVLSPLEKTLLLQFDLKNVYEIIKPGTYCITIQFPEETPLKSKFAISSGWFELKK